MSTYDGVRVRASQLLGGYRLALWRFYDAVKGQEPERERAFFALFEALNWAVALDEVIGEIWRPGGQHEGRDWRRNVGGEAMDAVRYVRNRVHHQWADALRWEEDPPSGLPFRGGTWVWRSIEELPSPGPGMPDKRGQAAYRELVAHDRRAVFTLADLDAVFGKVIHLLEPPRAPAEPAAA